LIYRKIVKEKPLLFPCHYSEKVIQPLRENNDLVRVRSNFQVIVLMDHDIRLEMM
jgi:hypothetical protein